MLQPSTPQRLLLSHLPALGIKIVVAALLGAGMSILAFVLTATVAKGLGQISLDASTSSVISPLTAVIFLLTGCLITLASGAALSVAFHVLFKTIYSKLSDILIKTLVVNLLLIFPFVLVYILSAGSFGRLYVALMIHVSLSAFVSACIIDSVALPRYVIVHLLGYTMGLVSVAMIVIVALGGDAVAYNLPIIVMVATPCIANILLYLTHSIRAVIYSKLATGGRDFLALQPRPCSDEKNGNAIPDPTHITI